MKTNITSVIVTGLKLTILSLIFISINLKLNAQVELKRTYLKLYYTKNSDESKSLTANISYKENGKFVAVKNDTISFYSGVDLDELIKIHKSPMFVRLRNLMPEIVQKMMVFFTENQETLLGKIEKIIEDVENEFAPNKI